MIFVIALEPWHIIENSFKCIYSFLSVDYRIFMKKAAKKTQSKILTN